MKGLPLADGHGEDGSGFGDRMSRVVMLLSNPAVNDPRVQKEARALSSAGYRVTIVAWDRGCDCDPVEEADCYRVERLRVKASYGRGLLQAPALLKFYALALPKIRRLKPAVLHCHDLETLPLGVVTARILGCRLIFDAHEPSYYADARTLRCLATATAGLLETTLSGVPDAVLVTNQYQLKKYRDMNVRNVHLVANYPETKLISDRPVFRDTGPLTIGRIGAVYYDMGLEELAEAYLILRKEVPDLRLLLVGQSTEEYRASLAGLAGGLSGDVRVVGRYEYNELPSYYGQLDVCIMPQKKTQWFEHITPTKFFEALCFGVPVVTTDIGGLGDIVTETGCGVVLDNVTPQAICDAVRPLLRESPLRRDLGEKGIRSVKAQYNWDHSVRSLLEVYDGIGATCD